MPTDHRALLAKIKRFDQLITYLRDEIGWPINQESFEELTFEYTPEELGIDAASAAKIQEIKRLRPLSANQPWGIFFVKFEPKKLPVVALRRILSQVALKKRASANSAERAAWAADDLLFVSNYGDGDERQISFAHFSQDRTKADLPILKVLGWNDRDTALHLDGVATELATKLSWPEDDSNVDRWREKWRSAFTLRPDEVIKTSKALAVELARLARRIRDRIRTVLAIETEHGPVTKLMKAFQEALVHDLDAGGFADMYAQTVAYGLLSARVTNPKANTAEGFAAQLPVTNPFLKELMETFLHVGGRNGKAGRGPGIDFDELGVSEVVELLDDANMDAVVRDFGDRNPQEDPVIHFYELFLKEYDAKKRMQRGVFYTPRPVVSYIVRSVHELLQTEFDLPDGLADTASWGELAKGHAGLTIPEGVKPTDRFVTILDPATGTGTFLVEAIEVIYRTLVGKWKSEGHGEKKTLDLWNDYVPKHLLPRLHGYELLMAPYAIAHLKIGLKLHETGYRFSSGERARIFLTNALEPAHDFSERFEFAIPALAHEAQAVNDVKRKQQFTVVIGNPPYSGHSLNNQVVWIVNKVYDYKRGYPDLQKAGQAKWLQDDYVKFIRLGEHLLSIAPVGILAYISNHSYLDNATFKGMRCHLMETFARLSLLDLHGSSKKQEKMPDGAPDENVFDIQQGVAIILARRGGALRRLEHGDLLGSRETKYGWLAAHSVRTSGAKTISPAPDLFLYTDRDDSLSGEYEACVSLVECMGENGDPAPGIVTTHDEFAISWSRAEAAAKVERLLATKTESEARSYFTLCSQSQWNYRKAKTALADGSWRKQIVRILYRPFDWRWTVFNSHVAVHLRQRVMRHMLDGGNIGLICTRQTKDQWGVFVTRDVCAHKTCGAYDINFLFPLELRPDSGGLGLEPQRPRPNISKAALDIIRGRLPRSAPPDIAPERLFHFFYGMFYSSAYRARYADFLRTDFPRVPLPGDVDLFREFARLGEKLVALHLMESPKLDQFITTYNDLKNPEVRRVGWSNDTVWLDAAATKRGRPASPGTIGFRGVPEAVWNFHIGGYQVCEKWLKDRKGRTLSKDDIAHYQKIVVALSETIRLMQEIDEVIERHGGWPRAFQTGNLEQESALEAAEKPENYGG